MASFERHASASVRATDLPASAPACHRATRRAHRIRASGHPPPPAGSPCPERQRMHDHRRLDARASAQRPNQRPSCSSTGPTYEAQPLEEVSARPECAAARDGTHAALMDIWLSLSTTTSAGGLLALIQSLEREAAGETAITEHRHHVAWCHQRRRLEHPQRRRHGRARVARQQRIVRLSRGSGGATPPACRSVCICSRRPVAALCAYA